MTSPPIPVERGLDLEALEKVAREAAARPYPGTPEFAAMRTAQDRLQATLTPALVLRLIAAARAPVGEEAIISAAYALTPAEQFKLATRIASNVGYDLVREGSYDNEDEDAHPPSPEPVAKGREGIARIIDPTAFETLREIAAARGLDAGNPPAGVVIMEAVDESVQSREPRRKTALAKADAIIALLSQEGGDHG